MLAQRIAPATRLSAAPPITPMREIDYRALRLLMTRSDGGSRFAMQRALAKFDKAWQRGTLYIPATETQEQKWWRCEARFMLGDYSDWGGWQYRDDWATRVWFENPFTCPVWTGGHVSRLAIVGEQGLGDEVLFANCLPDAMARVGAVTVECAGRLNAAFARSFGVDVVAPKMKWNDISEREERIMRDPAEYGCDAWATLADLGRIFRHRDSDFHRTAYLKADREQVERFRGLQGRVGISWRGAQGQADWREWLKKYPNAVSLQYDQAWDEDVERPDCDLLNDIEGVLGVLANLERVACVSTTVAHFAAAMGCPTEVRLAKIGSGRKRQLVPWKWINRRMPGQTLWYPSTTRTYEAGT